VLLYALRLHILAMERSNHERLERAH